MATKPCPVTCLIESKSEPPRAGVTGLFYKTAVDYIALEEFKIADILDSIMMELFNCTQSRTSGVC